MCVKYIWWTSNSWRHCTHG